MKITFRTAIFGMLMTLLFCVGAHAMENHMIKVGLKYGSDALYAANLENHTGYGVGYTLGYYDEQRIFVPLTTTEREALSIVADGNSYILSGSYYDAKPSSYTDTVGGYHLQIDGWFETMEEAEAVASAYEKAFPVFYHDACGVRIGQYMTAGDAEAAAAEWSDETYAVTVVSPSDTGVTVTVKGAGHILFEFDCGGEKALAIEPKLGEDEEKGITWFKSKLYYGGFEYPRAKGGNLNVINVLHIEDYVKCVIPYEMSNTYPIEALKAQAVCARTYAACQKRHRSQGFDVCPTTDCQMYSGTSACNEQTDSAVEQTEGMYLYYDGKIVTEAVYYASNGGASEDCENVWGSQFGYLKGKVDPYEADVGETQSNYHWTMTYTVDELTKRLESKGYQIGTVQNAYVSQFTDLGNVLEVTFVGSKKTITVKRESCRLVLGTRSMRFDISGGAGEENYYVNDADTAIHSLRGLFVLGGEKAESYGKNATETYVATSGGVSKLNDRSSEPVKVFTITGSGHGHNVGFSQIGACAMAKRGFTYDDILRFYYTGIELRKE